MIAAVAAIAFLLSAQLHVPGQSNAISICPQDRPKRSIVRRQDASVDIVALLYPPVVRMLHLSYGYGQLKCDALSFYFSSVGGMFI